jgi:hypothetical protein
MPSNVDGARPSHFFPASRGQWPNVSGSSHVTLKDERRVVERSTTGDGRNGRAGNWVDGLGYGENAVRP